MAESKNIVLMGVDGGGTGCRVAISGAGLPRVATAQGGAANVTTQFDEAVANIRFAVSEAMHLAGLDDGILQSAQIHMGLAGAVSEAIAARVAAAFAYPNIVVTDDRPTSVAGALHGRDGFLASIGTGTIVAAQQEGRFTFVGGWGFQVSDQASGAWLGRRVLEATLMCHDGLRADSDLTRSMMRRFGDDPNEIVAFAGAARPDAYARLAPDVVAAATSGDAIGMELMCQGAEYLRNGLTVLGFSPGAPLCLTGGVGARYVPWLGEDVASGVTAALGTPLDGALHLAGLAARQRDVVPS